MEIDINGLKWKICEDNQLTIKSISDNPNSDNYYFGLCDYTELIIHIDCAQKTEVKAQTLRHELTHAFIFSHGFGDIENFNVETICNFIASYGKQINDIVEDFMKND